MTFSAFVHPLLGALVGDDEVSGLFTVKDELEAMLAFWQGEAGVPLDHVLKIRRGHDQHRHDCGLRRSAQTRNGRGRWRRS